MLITVTAKKVKKEKKKTQEKSVGHGVGDGLGHGLAQVLYTPLFPSNRNGDRKPSLANDIPSLCKVKKNGCLEAKGAYIFPIINDNLKCLPFLLFVLIPAYNGHTLATCLIFFSRAKEVAHFFICPVKSAIKSLHPG